MKWMKDMSQTDDDDWLREQSQADDGTKLIAPVDCRRCEHSYIDISYDIGYYDNLVKDSIEFICTLKHRHILFTNTFSVPQTIEPPEWCPLKNNGEL